VKEIQKAEEMPPEEKIGMPQRMKYKSSGEDTLYPLKELEALELAGSDSEQELSESEEEELEEEAAIYEEERYGPRWRATVKKPKVMDPLWARLVIFFFFSLRGIEKPLTASLSPDQNLFCKWSLPA